MRVVVFQGQFGIFRTDDLDLSMPAIQTCIGVFAENKGNGYILCAHFDTGKGLRHNLDSIKRALAKRGLGLSDFRFTIFGGDGKLSYLRCSPPSVYIGETIIHLLAAEGAHAVYSDRYYSGIWANTFNFHYKNGATMITPGIDHRDFLGFHPHVKALADRRIVKRPDEYSIDDAAMHDISHFYLNNAL